MYCLIAVFILTRYLGSHTENRVYACFSSNGNPKWIFNSPPTIPMDYGVDGCSVDYATNTLYCGTELIAATGPTLFAIDTITKALKWSQNAGPIKPRPQVVQPTGIGGGIYIATSAGLVRKFDYTTGSPVWNAPLQIQSRLAVWPEPSGAVAIFAVDQTGFLHGIRDVGPNSVPIFLPTQSNGIPFVSAPVVDPVSGKAYIGLSNGKVAQVCVSNGQTEAEQSFVNSSTIYDPILDVSGFGGSDLDRLLISGSDASSLQVARFCVPFLSTKCGSTTAAPISERVPLFALRPISPNPSSGSVNISYEIAKDSNVEISVIDPGGRMVRSLVHGRQTPGPHGILWDGRNDQGEVVANGVYLVKLRTGADAFEQTKKIVLMR